jgi:hypothetical protein
VENTRNGETGIAYRKNGAAGRIRGIAAARRRNREMEVVKNCGTA